MERKPEPHDLLVALLLVQSLIERRSDAFFQPYGLTGAQFNILNLLAYHDGKMDQAALVDLLLVGKSSISIVLNRMVRENLVKREEHPQDRRQVVLVLTAKGRALWRKIAPARLQVIAARSDGIGRSQCMAYRIRAPRRS